MTVVRQWKNTQEAYAYILELEQRIAELEAEMLRMQDLEIRRGKYCIRLEQDAERYRKYRWISVDDALPEPYESVMAIGGHVHEWPCYHTATGWKDCADDDAIVGITHWRPAVREGEG